MRKILLIAVAFSFITATGYSQEDVLRPNGKANSESSTSRSPWAIGLEAGLGYNMYSADLNWTDEFGDPTDANSVFNLFNSLTGISPHIGFFVDYDFNSMFGLHVKFLYNQYRYSNNSDGIVDFFDGTTNPTTYLGTEIMNFEVEDRYNFFSFEPHLRINATEELYFLVGPSFNYGMGTRENELNSSKEETNINFVGDGTIDENHKSITVSSDFKDTRYALNIGAGYKFHLVNSVYLAPQIMYNFGLSKYNDQSLLNTDQTVTQDLKELLVTNQSINQLRFSITLWFENL